MNIETLTALFQQHLRDEETSFSVEVDPDRNTYLIDTTEDEVVHRFHEFIEQMIKEGLIEIK